MCLVTTRSPSTIFGTSIVLMPDGFSTTTVLTTAFRRRAIQARNERISFDGDFGSIGVACETKLATIVAVAAEPATTMTARRLNFSNCSSVRSLTDTPNHDAAERDIVGLAAACSSVF